MLQIGQMPPFRYICFTVVDDCTSDSEHEILQNVTSLAWNPSWQSLLSNGTVNWPANNFLTGIVYGKFTIEVFQDPLFTDSTGDYYYITAANKLVQMGLAECNGSTASNPASNTTSTPSPASNRASLAQLISQDVKLYIIITLLSMYLY